MFNSFFNISLITFKHILLRLKSNVCYCVYVIYFSCSYTYFVGFPNQIPTDTIFFNFPQNTKKRTNSLSIFLNYVLNSNIFYLPFVRKTKKKCAKFLLMKPIIFITSGFFFVFFVFELLIMNWGFFLH